MSTDQRKRASIVPDQTALAVLAATPDTDGINGSLRRFAALVAAAARDLEAVLSRPEWNYLAAALNGCADLWAWTDAPVPALTLIAAEAWDAHRLNREGDQWFGGKKKADEAVAELCRKLKALTPAHGEAVRRFWADTGIDHAQEEWWTLAHRLRAAAKGE